MSAVPSTAKLWYDADRPRAFAWTQCVRHEAPEVTVVEEEDELSASIVPPPPRGADDPDSDDASLEDPQSFADMERLMNELDDVALNAAGASRSGTAIAASVATNRTIW